MQPERFLDAAQRLAAGNGPEDFRSISRAYYAVFNVAERFLEQMRFHRPKKDYHPTLHKRLMASGDQAIHRIGSDLSDFHAERVDADYHMAKPAPENPANANAAVVKARQMIGTLGTCPINSTRWKAIQAEIARINITGTDHLAVVSGS